MEVRNALLEEMRGGSIHDGEKIPTEPELCARFGVSRITVRRAVKELVSEGALEKRHGVGTFARVSGFAPSLMSLGGFGAARNLRSQARRKVVRAENRQLSKEEAATLNLRTGAEAVFLMRVLLDGELPLAIDRTLYPTEGLPGFLEDFEEEQSTFQYLADKYGRQPSSSEGTLKIGYATAHEAELLGLGGNEALIRVTKMVKDQHEVPLLISRLALHPVRTNLSFAASRDEP